MEVPCYKNNVKVINFQRIVNPCSGWGRHKGTSFSLVTSTNVEVSPKIFFTFRLNPFVTLV